MLFEQFQRELLVPLRVRGVAHHVGEHDGGEFAVLGSGIRHKELGRSGLQSHLLEQFLKPWLGAQAVEKRIKPQERQVSFPLLIS